MLSFFTFNFDEKLSEFGDTSYILSTLNLAGIVPNLAHHFQNFPKLFILKNEINESFIRLHTPEASALARSLYDEVAPHFDVMGKKRLHLGEVRVGVG